MTYSNVEHLYFCLSVYLLVSLILNWSTNVFILLASIFLGLSFFFFFNSSCSLLPWRLQGCKKHITCDIQKLGIVAGSSLTPRVSPASFPFLPELVFFSTEDILTAVCSKALSCVRYPYTTAAIFLNTETFLYQRTKLHRPACPSWAQRVKHHTTAEGSGWRSQSFCLVSC